MLIIVLVMLGVSLVLNCYTYFLQCRSINNLLKRLREAESAIDLMARSMAREQATISQLDNLLSCVVVPAIEVESFYIPDDMETMQ